MNTQHYSAPCFGRDVKPGNTLVANGGVYLVESIKPYGWVEDNHYQDIVYHEVNTGHKFWTRINSNTIYQIKC